MHFFLQIKETVRFSKPFRRNINNQKYHLAKNPFLYGKVFNVEKGMIKEHKSVNVFLDKISDYIGTLKVQYQNASFNSMGMLTHETHILL